MTSRSDQCAEHLHERDVRSAADSATSGGGDQPTFEQAAAARSERSRPEQLAACSASAGALTELKRAVITGWFRRHKSPMSEETRAAWVEADRLGAAAEAARFGVGMLLDDPALAELADDGQASIAALGQMEEREDLRTAEKAFAAAVRAFVAAAARTLR